MSLESSGSTSCATLYCVAASLLRLPFGCAGVFDDTIGCSGEQDAKDTVRDPNWSLEEDLGECLYTFNDLGD